MFPQHKPNDDLDKAWLISKAKYEEIEKKAYNEEAFKHEILR